jgi:arginine decarboxylase
VRRYAELAVRSNRMTLDETRSLVRMYEQGLSGYTYLERG